MKVLTSDSIQKLRDIDNNSLNSHRDQAKESLPALSVHFERGEFRELEKYIFWFACYLLIIISCRLLYFNCKKVTYIWDSQKQEFVKLHGLDHCVATDVLHRNKGLTNGEQFTR